MPDHTETTTAPIEAPGVTPAAEPTNDRRGFLSKLFIRGAGAAALTVLGGCPSNDEPRYFKDPGSGEGPGFGEAPRSSKAPGSSEPLTLESRMAKENAILEEYLAAQTAYIEATEEYLNSQRPAINAAKGSLAKMELLNQNIGQFISLHAGSNNPDQTHDQAKLLEEQLAAAEAEISFLQTGNAIGREELESLNEEVKATKSFLIATQRFVAAKRKAENEFMKLVNLRR